MDYIAFENINNYSKTHSFFAEKFKRIFKEDDCLIYYKYPIFKSRARKNKEPDFIILHREYGLHLIEIRDFKLSNIIKIDQNKWVMKDWGNEIEEPLLEAENQLIAIQSNLNEYPESRNKIRTFKAWTLLPLIKNNEFNFQNDELTKQLLFIDDYETKLAISENSVITPSSISDEDWESVVLILNGSIPKGIKREIPTGTDQNNPIRVISYLESQLKILDEQQQKIAYEIPDGAQRLRGLAGTGKTVLLTKRIAKIHAKYPNFEIAFVFFTRSLYELIRSLISDYYKELTGNSINWNRVHVLHAWGAVDQPGYYSLAANASNQRTMTVDDVRRQMGKRPTVSDCFSVACDNLLNSTNVIPEIYDAVIIDEGQSLPASFYKLVYRTTKSVGSNVPPLKRIYWAYDEAQSLGSMIIPKSEETFGRDKNNNLLVDVRGSYLGGIQKSYKMTRCYRTPRKILMIAHAINMGLFREGGAIQGVTNKNDWESLGYQVIEGDFRKIGEPIKITRPEGQNPHPIDSIQFELRDALGKDIICESFFNEEDEMEWVVRNIKDDLRIGYKLEDLMITAIFGDGQKQFFEALQRKLLSASINSFIAGEDGNPNEFRHANRLTISTIYRAQGNEAFKVYVMRFHLAITPVEWAEQTELNKRNEAFTALTRAKVWCVITGLDSRIFVEIKKALSQYPVFMFPAFRSDSLQKNIDDPEFVQESIIETQLEEIDPSLSEKTMLISEGERGHTYVSLFYPYLRNSKKIVIKEPYLRALHQLKNFVTFCNMLAPSSGLLDIQLFCKNEEAIDNTELKEKLDGIQKDLINIRIRLEYSIVPALHDRSIESDNGWKIKSGFGLDIYQKPASFISLEEIDQKRRKCKQNEIEYIYNKLERPN